MDFRDLLCDACLYKVETELSVRILDMCDRCRKKVGGWIAAAFDEDEEKAALEEADRR
jgi:hypothetical protein